MEIIRSRLRDFIENGDDKEIKELYILLQNKVDEVRLFREE